MAVANQQLAESLPQATITEIATSYVLARIASQKNCYPHYKKYKHYVEAKVNPNCRVNVKSFEKYVEGIVIIGDRQLTGYDRFMIEKSCSAMKSPDTDQVLNSLSQCGHSVFRDGLVSWSRITGMFEMVTAVAGYYANINESNKVKATVDWFIKFISRADIGQSRSTILNWVNDYGGWEEIIKEARRQIVLPLQSQDYVPRIQRDTMFQSMKATASSYSQLGLKRKKSNLPSSKKDSKTCLLPIELVGKTENLSQEAVINNSSRSSPFVPFSLTHSSRLKNFLSSSDSSTKSRYNSTKPTAIQGSSPRTPSPCSPGPSSNFRFSANNLVGPTAIPHSPNPSPTKRTPSPCVPGPSTMTSCSTKPSSPKPAPSPCPEYASTTTSPFSIRKPGSSHISTQLLVTPGTTSFVPSDQSFSVGSSTTPRSLLKRSTTSSSDSSATVSCTAGPSTTLSTDSSDTSRSIKPKVVHTDKTFSVGSLTNTQSILKKPPGPSSIVSRFARPIILRTPRNLAPGSLLKIPGGVDMIVQIAPSTRNIVSAYILNRLKRDQCFANSTKQYKRKIEKALGNSNMPYIQEHVTALYELGLLQMTAADSHYITHVIPNAPPEDRSFRMLSDIGLQLFKDGRCSWNRIVGMLELAAELAVACKQQPEMIQTISIQMTNFIEEQTPIIGHWIRNEGGWTTAILELLVQQISAPLALNPDTPLSHNYLPFTNIAATTPGIRRNSRCILLLPHTGTTIESEQLHNEQSRITPMLGFLSEDTLVLAEEGQCERQQAENT